MNHKFTTIRTMLAAAALWRGTLSIYSTNCINVLHYKKDGADRQTDTQTDMSLMHTCLLRHVTSIISRCDRPNNNTRLAAFFPEQPE